MYALGLMFILPVLAVIGISLLWVIIDFIKEKGLHAVMTLIVIFSLSFLVINLKIESMEQNIKDKSIEKFGIEPEYIDINFNLLREGGGHPHATVCKDGQKYYWSFKENDFVDYCSCIDKKALSKSIDMLVNENIFNKNRTLERVKKN